MPVAWNDTTNAYMLGLLIRHVGKVPINEMVGEWTEDPSAPCEAPTNKALTLQIAKLKNMGKAKAAKENGHGAAGSKTASPKTPSKRKTAATGTDDEAATPTAKSAKKSASKRKTAPKVEATPQPETTQPEATQRGSSEAQLDDGSQFVKKEADDGYVYL